MGKGSIAYLSGMLSMLLLLLAGNQLFDHESKDFEYYRNAFYEGYDLHQNVIINRMRIHQALSSTSIGDKEKEALLNQLWSLDNAAMLSHMLIYLETNEKVSPLFQINSDKGKNIFEQWIMLQQKKQENIDKN